MVLALQSKEPPQCIGNAGLELGNGDFPHELVDFREGSGCLKGLCVFCARERSKLRFLRESLEQVLYPRTFSGEFSSSSACRPGFAANLLKQLPLSHRHSPRSKSF